MRALEWRDVDLAGKVVRLRPEISKDKKGRLLPLQNELLEIVRRAHANRRLDCNAVFHKNGKSIGDFRKAWNRRYCQHRLEKNSFMILDAQLSGISPEQVLQRSFQ
jgi:integrase